MRRRFAAGIVVTVLVGLTMTSVGTSAPKGGTPLTGAGSGGVLLDGWGGLHVFGGASVNIAGAPYWPGWDIARSIAVKADGSGGWTLDGWGGIHPWGAAGRLVGPYWPNWDIARALWVNAAGTGGYMLDGWGGIHPFGGVPSLGGAPYWRGWDIARGLDIHLNSSGTPDGGWTLDGWGGVHPWGAAPALASPGYAGGYDVYQRLHVVSGGAYAVTRFGLVSPMGNPAGIDWSRYPSWGTWDIVRDVVPLNASLSATPTPFVRGSVAGMMDRLMSIDRQQRGASGIAPDGALTPIAGNGASYNLGSCGGSAMTITDRAADMYQRNYFAHAIEGCSGTQYVFSTYMRAYNVSYSRAGENIAWRINDSSLMSDIVAVNQMWLNSPEHYANIMGAYSSVGCGADYVKAGSYQGFTGPTWVWVCDFRG